MSKIGNMVKHMICTREVVSCTLTIHRLYLNQNKREDIKVLWVRGSYCGETPFSRPTSNGVEYEISYEFEISKFNKRDGSTKKKTIIITILNSDEKVIGKTEIDLNSINKKEQPIPFSSKDVKELVISFTIGRHQKKSPKVKGQTIQVEGIKTKPNNNDIHNSKPNHDSFTNSNYEPKPLEDLSKVVQQCQEVVRLQKEADRLRHLVVNSGKGGNTEKILDRISTSLRRESLPGDAEIELTREKLKHIEAEFSHYKIKSKDSNTNLTSETSSTLGSSSIAATTTPSAEPKQEDSDIWSSIDSLKQSVSSFYK